MTEQHDHGAEALSAKLESSEKLRSWVIRSVICFLILVFLGGLAWGANDLLGREGQELPPLELDETITSPPAGAQEIFACIQSAVDMALEQRPRFSMGTKFDFGGDYLKTAAFSGEGADAAKAERLLEMTRILAPDIVARLNNSFPGAETQYGEDFDALLWALQFAPEDLESADCEFIYYSCTACNRNEAEAILECPKCGAKQDPDAKKPLFEKSYRDNYTFTLQFADDSPVIGEVFHARTPEAIAALLGRQLEGFAEIQGVQREYRGARIVAAVNRTTKKLLSIQFHKDIDIALDLRLNPDLENLDTTFTCTLGESTEFKCTWPAVYLSNHEMTLDRRADSQLTARIDAPEGQKTPLTWISSDPEICAVDQDGYLKAGHAFGEAVITASFTLGGKTYEDSCDIHVKVPAEKVSLNRRSLRLDTGETKQLKATVSPGKATYRDVTWHTESPGVAAVDENGLVTALAPGETAVYAVTVDGYYRASCRITVGGGN